MTDLLRVSGLQDDQQCQTAGRAIDCPSLAYMAHLGINVKDYFMNSEGEQPLHVRSAKMSSPARLQR